MSATDERWWGIAGHLIVARDCRFHLCTTVNGHMISTVGEYLPDSNVRDIFAESRGITLEGRGDMRLADYMNKIGFEEVGCGRKYETMVFRLGDGICEEPTCGCGMPKVSDWTEIDFAPANTAGEATKNHYELLEKYR